MKKHRPTHSIKFMIFLLLASLGMIFTGTIIQNLTNTQISLDSRSDASTSDASPSITITTQPASPRVNDTVTVFLNVNTGSYITDGFQITNLSITSDITNPSFPSNLENLNSSLNTLKNQLSNSSLSYTAIPNDIISGFTTNNQTISMAKFVFIPDSPGSISLTFDPNNTAITEHSTGTNLLSQVSNKTIYIEDVPDCNDNDDVCDVESCSYDQDACDNLCDDNDDVCDQNSCNYDQEACDNLCTQNDDVCDQDSCNYNQSACDDLNDNDDDDSGIGGDTSDDSDDQEEVSCDLPSAPSTIIARTGINPGEIIVRWIRPDDRNYFGVSFGTGSGSYEWGSTNIGDIKDFTIRYLNPGSKYYIVVNTVNDCGTSPFSAEVSAIAKKPTNDTYIPTTSTPQIIDNENPTATPIALSTPKPSPSPTPIIESEDDEDEVDKQPLLPETLSNKLAIGAIVVAVLLVIQKLLSKKNPPLPKRHKLKNPNIKVEDPNSTNKPKAHPLQSQPDQTPKE